MRKTILVVIFLSSAAVSGFAEVNTGNLVATIKDPSGAVVACVTVTATNMDTGTRTVVEKGLNLEFRAEFFNAFNHPVFSRPHDYITDGPGAAGVITSTVIPQRQIRFDLKLQF